MCAILHPGIFMNQRGEGVLGVEGPSAKRRSRHGGFRGGCEGRDSAVEGSVFGSWSVRLGRWTHLGVVRAAMAVGRAGGGAAALSGGSVEGRESAHQHVPVRRRASGGHGDAPAGDGEARRGAEHAPGESAETPPGSGHALQHGALGVHDLGSRSQPAAGAPGYRRRRRPPSRASRSPCPSSGSCGATWTTGPGRRRFPGGPAPCCACGKAPEGLSWTPPRRASRSGARSIGG